MSVREATIKALEDGYAEGIKGLYGAAIANSAGGESLDKVMERFHAGIVLEACKLHARVISEVNAVLDKEGIT